MSGATRANGFGRAKDYFARVGDETAVLLQLESRVAVERAEEIAGVEGVTGVFFGPGDIAADLGHLGLPMHPEVWDLIRPAARALIAKGVPVGTLVLDPQFAAQLLNEGFTFVACGMDTVLLSLASDALLAQVRGGTAQ